MKLIPGSSARRMVRIPFSWSGITPRAEHHRPQGTGPDRNAGASENVIFHQIPFKGMLVTRQFRLLRSEITKSVGSRDATVDQKVATGDEPALGPHQQRPNGTDLIGRNAPQTGHSSIMGRYPSRRGPVSSSFASGVKMKPGLIVLTRQPCHPRPPTER